MSSTEIGIKPGTSDKQNAEVKFSEKLNDFMHKNRKLFMAIGITALALVVILGVTSVITSGIARKSTIALEKLEMEYSKWYEAEDSEKTSLSTAVIEMAANVAKTYGKRYAAARATMIKAEVLYASKDLKGAEAGFSDVATSFPKLHLAPVALANAATVAEDQGDTESALNYLLQAESKYPGFPGSGRVSLSIGRIYESTKQYGKAMETYSRLLSTGVESDWTKIAQDRIILLKSQGVAE